MKSILDHVSQPIHIGETWLIGGCEYTITGMTSKYTSYTCDIENEPVTTTIRIEAFVGAINSSGGKLVKFVATPFNLIDMTL